MTILVTRPFGIGQAAGPGAPAGAPETFTFLMAAGTDLYKSSDGFTWVDQSVSASTQHPAPIAYDGTSEWIVGSVAGAAGNILRTATQREATSWTTSDPLDSSGWNEYGAVMYNPVFDTWVMGRDAGSNTQPGIAVLDASTQTLPGTGSWTPVNLPPPAVGTARRAGRRQLPVNPNTGTMVCGIRLDESMYYSNDGGYTWNTATPNTFIRGANQIIWDPFSERFIAASTQGELWASTNGIDWGDTTPAVSFSTGDELHWLDVKPSNGNIVAGANGTDGRLAVYRPGIGTTDFTPPGAATVDRIDFVTYSERLDSWLFSTAGTGLVYLIPDDDIANTGASSWTDNRYSKPVESFNQWNAFASA